MSESETDTVEKKPLKTIIKDVVFFVLRISIAVVLIGWLISRKEKSPFDILKEFNYYWLIPAALLYGGHLCAGAWRWWILLKVQEVKISYFEAVSLTFQGFFFSCVLPGSLGGDFVKAAYISKRAPEGKKLTGAFTILIDRVLGMMSLFSLSAIAGLISYKFLFTISKVSDKSPTAESASYIPDPLQIILYTLLLGCCFGLLSGVLLFFHRLLEKIPPIKWCINFADKLSKGAMHRLMDAMDSFKKAWPAMIKVILISIFLIHLVLSFVVFCISQGLNTPKVDTEIYVLSTTLGNAAGSVPLTPAGVGPREFIITEVFANALVQSHPSMSKAIASDYGANIALGFLAIYLFFNLSGGLFFIFDKLVRKKECSLST